MEVMRAPQLNYPELPIALSFLSGQSKHNKFCCFVSFHTSILHLEHIYMAL